MLLGGTVCLDMMSCSLVEGYRCEECCINLYQTTCITSYNTVLLIVMPCEDLLPYICGVGGKEKTPWSESASELYRLSDCRLSAK
jgi:hypothetical protein